MGRVTGMDPSTKLEYNRYFTVYMQYKHDNGTVPFDIGNRQKPIYFTFINILIFSSSCCWLQRSFMLFQYVDRKKFAKWKVLVQFV